MGHSCWHFSQHELFWSPKISMRFRRQERGFHLSTSFLRPARRQGIVSSPLSYFTVKLIHWNWKGSFEWSNGKFQIHLFSLTTLPSFRRSLMQQKRQMHAFHALFGIFKCEREAKSLCIIMTERENLMCNKVKWRDVERRSGGQTWAAAPNFSSWVEAFIYYLVN